MLALRVGRRRTSWESGDIDTIVRAEFWSDGAVELAVSVYVVNVDDVLRTVTEHCAGLGCNTRGFPNLNLEAGRELVQTPGETNFEFTAAAHRELVFTDESDLRTFLVDTVIPDVATRTHTVQRQEMRDFARGRRDAGDLEWVAFFERKPRWPNE